MKLDNQIEHNISVTKEQEAPDKFLVKENKLGDMFPNHPDYQAQLERFNNKTVRAFISSEGADRPKSYNPAYDHYEKELSNPSPPIGIIYQLEKSNVNNKEITSYTKYIPKEPIKVEVKRISLLHQFLNYITRSGKQEKKFTDKL